MAVACLPLGFMTSLSIGCCLSLQYKTWIHGFSPIDLTSDLIRQMLVSPPTQYKGTTILPLGIFFWDNPQMIFLYGCPMTTASHSQKEKY